MTYARILRLDTRDLHARSMADWIEEQRLTPRLAQVIGSSVRVATYCADLALVSAGAALDQIRRAVTAGVLYLDHGWQQLVDGLHDAAVAAGATIVHAAAVGLVRDEQGHVSGVRLDDGRTLPTRSVMATGAPADVAALVGLPAPQTVAARVSCLDVALTGLPRPGHRFALGIDQPLYYSVHSETARLAPEGQALIHVAKYLTADDAPAEIDELTRVLDGLQPGWRDRVVHERFLPDLTVTHAIPTARAGGLTGRPDVDVFDIPGFAVAGDWVGPEGMLADASCASAVRAAERIAVSGRGLIG